jgi:hypothetical protein
MKPALVLALAGVAMCASACQGASSKAAHREMSSQKRPSSDASRDHCRDDEQVVFSCTIQRSVASVCAARAGESIRYLQGLIGKPELVFSAEDTGPGDGLKRSHLAFAGGTGGYAYSFVVGPSKFIVYSISGAENLEKAGVVTHPLKNPGQARELRCKRGSMIETDDMRLIKRTLALPEDPDLESGVPGLGE